MKPDKLYLEHKIKDTRPKMMTREIKIGWYNLGGEKTNNFTPAIVVYKNKEEKFEKPINSIDKLREWLIGVDGSDEFGHKSNPQLENMVQLTSVKIDFLEGKLGPESPVYLLAIIKNPDGVILERFQMIESVQDIIIRALNK